jgi:DNA polymerase-3 subunit alpha
VRYSSLHHHTTYSYQDGFGLPEDHVRRAADLGMGAIACTDHGNISAHVQLEIAAKEAGVKPIFGCELYTGYVDEDRKQRRKNHLTVLAENATGYRNLLEMVTQSWRDFYHEPTTGPDNLRLHKDGLVILSGCQGSLLATSLVGGKNVAVEDASMERGIEVASRFKKLFGDAYYLEVQGFPELETTKRINVMLEDISKRLGIPLVATRDVHYTKPSESEVQLILHNLRGMNNRTEEDQARSWMRYGPDGAKLCPPTSDMMLYRRLRACGLSKLSAQAAIINTEEIVARCNVELPKMGDITFPIPKGMPHKTSMEVWRAWLKEGWHYRGIPNKANWETYQTRLKYEMSIIEDKGFLDYFLIVSDIVKWAKDHGIPVGAGRGSAAGSLVCFLLRITEVDPMLFPNLVFERFIDRTRNDLPDIDLDFDDERRHEIKSYAIERYGVERVGNVGTFTKYKAKNSLEDVGRVHEVPVWKIDFLKGLMLERSSGDLRFNDTIMDTVLSNPDAKAIFDEFPDLYKAMKLEGNVKNFSTHAAGLFVAPQPLTDVCAVYRRIDSKKKVKEVVSLDKDTAKYVGALKIDLLGLHNMGMIRIALEAIGMTLKELYDLPLDDPETIDGFRTNDVVGIFQFEGRATRSVNEEVKPDNFLEICDVNALSRPGPLHSGASVDYVDAKFGGKEPEAMHPLLDPITRTTHQQIIYQEQILRIIMEVGNFDWTGHAYIRKIISQRMGQQEFNRQWDKFREGAIANGVDEATAKHIWGRCITAGAYAFNNAHTVSYSMLAYWCMWLKKHHTLVFYMAALRKSDEERTLELLRDAVRHGINVCPPDLALSQAQWTYHTESNSLIAGFDSLPGIGQAYAQAIVQKREAGAFHGDDGWEVLTGLKVGIGPKKILPVLEFVENPDPFRIYWMHNRIEGVLKEIKDGSLGWDIPIPTHEAAGVPQSKGKDYEVVWLGLIKHINLRELFEINNKRGTPLLPEEVKDPHLNEWVIMTGIDETDYLSITCDRWMYPKLKKQIWGIKWMDEVVLVRGVKKGWASWRSIYVKEMWVIQPDEPNDDPTM